MPQAQNESLEAWDFVKGRKRKRFGNPQGRNPQGLPVLLQEFERTELQNDPGKS
jgi:hypothetical protein